MATLGVVSAPCTTRPERLPAAAWWAALSLAAVIGFSRVSLGLLLPAMKADLPASYYGYGWIASANFAGYLLGNVALLFWMRRIRRPLLANAVSFAVMALSDVAVGFSSDIASVVAWRFINGFAQAAVLVLTVSLTLETVALELRGRISGVTWMGAAIGVTICGVAAPATLGAHPLLTWRTEWIAMGFLSLAVIPGFWVSVARAGKAPAASAATDARVESVPFALLCLIYASFGAAFILLFTYYSAFVRALGVAPQYLGFAWAAAGICGIASALLWGRAFDAWPRARLAAVPMMLGAIGTIVIASGRPALLIAGAVIALSSAFGFAGVFSAVARKFIPAAAFPLMFTIATIAFALGQIGGAPLGGALADRFGLSAAMIAASAAFALGAAFAYSLGRFDR